jgi:hypothetical protein
MPNIVSKARGAVITIDRIAKTVKIDASVLTNPRFEKFLAKLENFPHLFDWENADLIGLVRESQHNLNFACSMKFRDFDGPLFKRLSAHAADLTSIAEGLKNGSIRPE